jgi:hypothetical protein
MKKISLLLVVLLLFGCSGKSLNPMYPNKAATHVVEFYKVQIGADDFSLSTFGNPLDIKVSIKENGKTIASQLIYGTRGERVFKTPISWIINFDPEKNYQIVLEEQSIIASAYVWEIPGTPKIGYWPIAKNNGIVTFGKNSYLGFKDRIAK